MSYYIEGMPISTTHNHIDLGIVINDKLNWNVHHDAVLNKVYRTLGLIRRTFSRIIFTSIVKIINYKFEQGPKNKKSETREITHPVTILVQI